MEAKKDGGVDGWIDGWMDGQMCDERKEYVISTVHCLVEQLLLLP